jgi:hypothetical protein
MHSAATRTGAARSAARFIAAALVLASFPASATGTYQEPEAFLADAFGGTVPEPQVLWLTQKLRAKSEHILLHPFNALRVRYWRSGERCAWVLEEVGRAEPITVGIVTDGRRIEQLRVLIFRESRGWEVRHAFFTDQFRDAGINEQGNLDRSIDGISGATLSVSALTRLARLALLFSDAVRKGGPAP